MMDQPGPPMDGVAERKDCNSVEEFLHEIDPLNVRYHRQHIFRGVRLSTMPLIPSALRQAPVSTNGLQLILNRLRYKDAPASLVTEFKLLRKFYWTLNQNGLAVPDDTTELRRLFRDTGEDLLTKTHSDDTAFWPPPSIDGLLGLAQHYGIPTRLLDWTRNPFHAAYFAAIGAVRCLTKLPDDQFLASDQRIAVWALSSEAMGFLGVSPFTHQDRIMEIVIVSGATNPNLYAQRGLFTVMRSKIAKYDPNFERLALNQQFRQLTNYLKEDDANKWLVRPFTLVTLPILLAPELAPKLAQLGVTAATAFPDFQGAAKSVLEEPMVDWVQQRLAAIGKKELDRRSKSAMPAPFARLPSLPEGEEK
jgi:hypothetical protein